jgi:hypothetical protein
LIADLKNKPPMEEALSDALAHIDVYAIPPSPHSLFPSIEIILIIIINLSTAG